MSNENPPKPKRSFRVIFKILKFIVAMVLTFFISFAVTLYMKDASIVNEILYGDEKIRSRGVPEIKTLFDERNNQPFDPSKYIDSEKKFSAVDLPPFETSLQTESEEEPEIVLEPELGVLDTLDTMTSIKPAVDEKLKNIPHYVSLERIPNFLTHAVISVEDTRFYKHKGFDFIGIARAVFVNVEAGEIQEGASTITQQTVKNLFLTSDQTFTRKAEELILSMNMEKDFDKNKILEIYLNSIYFGSDFYGVYDAAQGYFGKEPADLTIAECAMLAGLPNAPSLYSPYVDFHLAKQRQLVVIDAMEKAGVISKKEAESARIEEIVLVR